MQGKQTQITGQVLAAHTASFKDGEGKDIAFGRIQLVSKDDNGFFQLWNVKVRNDSFGALPQVAEMKGKLVTLEVSESSFTDPKTKRVTHSMHYAGLIEPAKAKAA